MRKRIIIGFALIFALFLVGSGTMIYQMVRTSSNLRYLIGLHEIEDIRQDLFSGIQKVQFYVYASSDVFTANIDEIISHTSIMHQAIRKCNDCHHLKKVREELDETIRLVDIFEEQLSYLITIVANVERRQNKQQEVYQISNTILSKVEYMVSAARATIQKRTGEAMDELNRVYFLVAVTLVCTVILALVIANYLANFITRPIDTLVTSTRIIANGQWGHQTTFQTTGEFKELVSSFNQMSASLAKQREQEKLHIRELHDTQKQLIEAEKLTALGTMAGGIAHDFNNILCGMIGHLNILSRQIPPDEEHKKTIETIEKAGFRAAELIKQLLTFARQKPMELKPISMNNCVRDVIQLIEKTFDKMISLDVDLSPDVFSVMGDPAQLEQVIINLCVNARDAMPEGGNISLRTASFTPDHKFCATNHDAKPQQYVMLTVKDTGTGINEKILPRIFDPFFTTKDVGKGTGLGLAMVYGIVKNHEGFCTIDSTPGQGTTINIYIPAIKDQSVELQPVKSTSIPADKTILIVDDEPLIILMLKDHLEGLGCKTLSAENGLEGIQVLKENSDEIDLIILDINMPVMCGTEAYPEFLKIKPGIPVLVSSGYIMNEDTREALDMGAQGFLQKPFRLEEVDAKIMEILNGQE
jgi:signal transduction histidine kinase/ActR/RegA family two-component response regulator